jgi:hypothetical protein
MKNLILHSEDGQIAQEELRDGEIEKVVKERVVKAAELWKPSESDLVVFMTKSEAKLKAPVTPQILEVIKPYFPARKGDEVVFNLPIYVISYRIEQTGSNSYKDKAIFVIAPYVNEELKEQTAEWAKELTGSELEQEEVS